MEKKDNSVLFVLDDKIRINILVNKESSIPIIAFTDKKSHEVFQADIAKAKASSGKPLSPEENYKLRHPAKQHIMSAIQEAYGENEHHLMFGHSTTDKDLKFTFEHSFIYNKNTGEIEKADHKKIVDCFNILEKKGILTIKKSEPQNTYYPTRVYNIIVNDEYRRYMQVKESNILRNVFGLFIGVSEPVELLDWESREQEIERGSNSIMAFVRYELVDKEPWYTDDIAALCPLEGTELHMVVKYYDGLGWKY